MKRLLLLAVLLAGPAVAAGNDPLRVADFGPIDGQADSTTLQAAFAAVTARLQAHGAAMLTFPAGRLVLHGSPTLTVPAGATVSLLGQATELLVDDDGNGLTVSVAPDPAALSTRVTVQGFRLVKGDRGGGNGIAVLGGPFLQQTIPTVRDVVCRNGQPDGNGWTSCVLAKDVVLGTFDDIHGFFTNSFGSPRDGTLIRLLAGNSPADPASRAAVDNKFSNLSSSGGFAGIWPTGHVEGVTMINFSFVGVAYGIYWPFEATSGAGLYIAASNGHINAQLRGVYANRVFDVMLNNILFFNPFGDKTPPPDALLPQDNTQWAATATSWAAIDIQNAANFTILGNTFYAAHVGSNAFASIVVDTGTDYRGGQDRPNVIVGNTFTGGNAPPIWLADGVRNTMVAANAIIDAPPMRLPATVTAGGNTVDGQFRIGAATLTFDDLPTRDPKVKGRVWRDATGALRVSAGP